MSLEERVLDGGGAHTAAYFAEHGTQLRPADVPVSTQSYPERQADLDLALMKLLVRPYGAAKSEIDFDAALTVCHPEFQCDTVCFGVTTRDKRDTATQFALFFDTFDEYRVSIDDMIAEGDHVCCWLHQEMKLTGNGLGTAATGKTSEQAFACVASPLERHQNFDAFDRRQTSSADDTGPRPRAKPLGGAKCTG